MANHGLRNLFRAMKHAFVNQPKLTEEGKEKDLSTDIEARIAGFMLRLIMKFFCRLAIIFSRINLCFVSLLTINRLCSEPRSPMTPFRAASR